MRPINARHLRNRETRVANKPEGGRMDGQERYTPGCMPMDDMHRAFIERVSALAQRMRRVGYSPCRPQRSSNAD
ncbi:MAG: hypothetical protein LBQ81_13605 [Zoogloeaceae bacterium]|nr:hypothetical protein [Zoogloeaceae bacterium]